MTNKNDLIVEATKAIPAASTLTLNMFGIPLSQWAVLLSIIVMLTQLVIMIFNQVKRHGPPDDK